jgi:NifU-like protein involved in Fe-S cluster formation
VNDQKNLKSKCHNFIGNLKTEILRTSAIGKKMLTAGRTNSHLKDTYEELGRIIESKFSSGEIEIDDAKIRSLLHTIKACKKDLREIEEQVNKIRFAPAPEDISKRLPPREDD